MGQLHRLVYASRATIPPKDFDDELRNLLIKSIVNNRRCDVTGLLLVHGDKFLQVLEGPQTSLETTFARIGADPRHESVTVISRGPAETRMFRDWNMCARRLAVSDLKALGLASDNFDPAELSAERALDLLASVGRVHAAA